MRAGSDKTSRLSSLCTHNAQGRSQGYSLAKHTSLDWNDMAANRMSLNAKQAWFKRYGGVCKLHTSRRAHHYWSALEDFHFLSEILEGLRHSKVKKKKTRHFFGNSEEKKQNQTAIITEKSPKLKSAIPSEHPYPTEMLCTSCCCVQTPCLTLWDSSHSWRELPLPMKEMQVTPWNSYNHILSSSANWGAITKCADL